MKKRHHRFLDRQKKPHRPFQSQNRQQRRTIQPVAFSAHSASRRGTTTSSARTRSCQSSISLPEGLILLGGCADMLSLTIAHLSRLPWYLPVILPAACQTEVAAPPARATTRAPAAAHHGNWWCCSFDGMTSIDKRQNGSIIPDCSILANHEVQVPDSRFFTVFEFFPTE